MAAISGWCFQCSVVSKEQSVAGRRELAEAALHALEGLVIAQALRPPPPLPEEQLEPEGFDEDTHFAVSRWLEARPLAGWIATPISMRVLRAFSWSCLAAWRNH